MSAPDSFVLPDIKEAVAGFGPPEQVDFFQEVPYATFSKSERLGRVADWISSKPQFQPTRYTSGSGDRAPAASPFVGVVDDEDGEEFELVDSRPASAQKGRGQYNSNRWGRGARRGGAANTRGGRPGQRPGQGGQQHTQQRGNQRNTRGGNQPYRRYNDRNRNIEASVQVDHSWGEPFETLEFSRLHKLKGTKYEDGELIQESGSVNYINTTITSTSKPINLEKQWANEKTFFKVTTSDDPVIRKLADQGEGTIFITDTILSILMTAPKSAYSWDVVITKNGNKIYFDKRNNKIDWLSVNENSMDPPDATESEPINQPAALSKEATFINQNFSQQVLLHDKQHQFDTPNPFGSSNVASVAYRYKSWALGDHVVICRTEVDAAKQGKNGETVFASVKALNEYDPKTTGDWRKKLNAQRTAIVATELKNNSAKLARWVVGSILAGSSSVELGFVSRVRPNENQSHAILAVQSFKPTELADSMGLNFENMWSIFKLIVDTISAQEDGKFLLMKDNAGPNLKVYKVPNNAFAEESTSSSGNGQLILK